MLFAYFCFFISTVIVEAISLNASRPFHYSKLANHTACLAWILATSQRPFQHSQSSIFIAYD